MRNFLLEALEQGEEEEVRDGVLLDEDIREIGKVGKGRGKVKGLRGHSFRKEWPLRLPKKAPEGESFDSLPLWTSPLNDQGRGPAGPLALEPSPGSSLDRLSAPAAYFVTPPGLGGGGVLLERERAPKVRRARAGAVFVRDLEEREALPLLSALRRAGEGTSFVRSQRRVFAVTVPATTAGVSSGLTVEGVDRAVERDARRYDGGFSLY